MSSDSININYKNLKYGLEFETVISIDIDDSNNFDLNNIENFGDFAKSLAIKLNDNLLLKNETDTIHNKYYYSYRTTTPPLMNVIPCESKLRPLDTTASTWVITRDTSVKYSRLSYQTMNDETLNDFEIDKTIPNLIMMPIYGHINKYLVHNVEFVSPILKPSIHGKQYWKDIINNMTCNGTIHYYHNKTTSQHIHLSHNNDFRNPEILLKICKAWLHFENVFMDLMPKWRKDNQYCILMHKLTFNNESHFSNVYKHLNKDLRLWDMGDIDSITDFDIDNDKNSILSSTDIEKKEKETFKIPKIFRKNGGEKSNIEEDSDIDERLYKIIGCFQGNPNYHTTRYAAFNMLNLLPGGYGTIEFRIKHGSNDPDEINMFVQLYSWFVIASMKYNDDIFLEIIEKTPTLETLKFFLKISNIPVNSLELLFNDLIRYKNNLSRVNFNFESELIGGNKKIAVFSYGSNHSKQLEQRTGAKNLKSIPACLPNHVRIFAGYSNHWKGGVASVYPSKGNVVYGALYYLTPSELYKLDQYEDGYNKVKKMVTLPNGKKTRAFMYIKRDVTWVKKPSIRYLNAINKTLEETYPKNSIYTQVDILGCIKDKNNKIIIQKMY